jgi:hypothetical protein
MTDHSESADLAKGFAAYAGPARFNKFVETLRHTWSPYGWKADRQSNRLLYWQEKLWQEFSAATGAPVLDYHALLRLFGVTGAQVSEAALATTAGDEASALQRAMENLRFKAGSIRAYRPVDIANGRRFSEQNPDHPMAEPQRFVRIRAADEIKDLATHSPRLFGQRELAALHDALFDRCAAVRLSVVGILNALRMQQSAGPLSELLKDEDESEWVRDAVAEALKGMPSGGAA